MRASGQAAVKPSLGLPLSVASVSTAAVVIRLVSADAVAVAALRLVFATAVFAPFAAATGLRDLAVLSKREILALLGIGFCLSARFALWITSLYLTTVAASVLMVSTSPIFVALFQTLFLEEKTTKMAAVGIALATTGVVCIAFPDARLSADLKGMVTALLAAVAMSGYLIAGRRMRQRLSLVSYVFCVYAASAVILVGLAATSGARLIGLPARDYAVLLVLGIVPSHFGHTLYNYLLRFLDPKLIAISTLGEPIVSSLLALVILGEMPQTSMVVAAPLVLLGIYLTARGTWLAR